MQGTAGGDYPTTRENVEDVMSELDAHQEETRWKRIPMEKMNISPTALKGRLGETFCWTAFGPCSVTLNPTYANREQLLGTVWHESRHFNGPWLEHALGAHNNGTIWHDNLDHWSTQVEVAGLVKNGYANLRLPLGPNGLVDMTLPNRGGIEWRLP